MTRIWAKHVEEGTTRAISNPFLCSFMAVLLGCFAGVEFIWAVESEAPRSLVRVVLDCSMILIFLGMALDASFMLASAVRKLQNISSPSSVPVGKGV